MSRSPLRSLVNRSIKNWFTKEVESLGNSVESSYRLRDEVSRGVLVAAASAASPALLGDYSVGDLVLAGKHFTKAVGTNVDLAPDDPSGTAIPNISLLGVHADVSTFLDTDTDYVDCVLVAIDSDGAGGVDGVARMLVVHNLLNTAGVPSILQVEQAIALAVADPADLQAHGGWVVLGSFRATRGVTNITLGTIVDNRSNYLNN